MSRRIMNLLVICAIFITLAVSSQSHGAMPDEVTFIFLADPQINREDGRNKENTRLAALSELNGVLNNIDSETWPSELANGNPIPLTCSGDLIGDVSCIFFGGDLTQAGGDQYKQEQRTEIPPNYKGGWELQSVRLLFDKGFTELKCKHDGEWINWSEDEFTKTKYKAIYFGLGNHDIQTEYHPYIGWWTGGNWTAWKDYWRYQMWNFISQMHAGPYYVREIPVGEYWRRPTFPVHSIDAPAPGDDYSHDCFDWTNYSFNYRVDLGPVEVFQLHNYGSDNEHGRAHGLSWLQDELSAVGTAKPIIIIQHLPFHKDDWAPAAKDFLKIILEPYNVIAFLTGHNHSKNDFPNRVPISGSSKSFQDFTAGMCSYGDSVNQARNFALVKVTDATFDIAYARVNSQGNIKWTAGYSMPGAEANGPYIGDEGSAITFDGSGSYGTIDEYGWDLDDNGTFEKSGQSVSQTWGDDYSGEVTLKVSNNKGGVDTDSSTVTVNNVAPTAGIDSITSPVEDCILPGQAVAFNGSFTDPGWLDTHTALWNFGDGNTDSGSLNEENTQPDATGTLSVEHTYGEPGTFTVVLTVKDDDASGTDQDEVKVMTASETIDFVDAAIQDMQDDCFKKNVEQRKNTLLQKCAEVKNAIESGDFRDAINKLRKDIRAKADGCVDGKPNNDWITDEEAQKALCLMVDELIKYLESLLDAEGAAVAEKKDKEKKDAEAAPGLWQKPEFAIFAAYPQPCNPEVWIPYTLGRGVDVNINIYDASGSLIRTLSLGYRNAGSYMNKDKAAYWDGTNTAGESVSSGIYFYIIQAGEFTASKKMIVVR